MVSQDINFIVAQLKKRVNLLEEQINCQARAIPFEEQDWDDLTLQKEWGVCRRTTAYYRKQGLGFYKRGGRVFYTQKHREEFQKSKM